jgi:hypothetical protein
MARNGGDKRWGKVGAYLVAKGDTRMRRSVTIGAALAALVVSGTMALPATVAGASPTTTLYVSPTANTHINNDHHNCATAGYATIQSAVNAAPDGTKIIVCKGTYHASLVIPATKTGLDIVGDTGAIVSPTAPAAPVTDPAAASVGGVAPIVAIVRVAPGATNTTISGLEINGAGIQHQINQNGCVNDLAGLYWGATRGHDASGTASDLDVVNTTPNNSGCGLGLGIYVDAGTGGTAKVTLHQNSVSGYGKNGITCGDIGVACSITANTITTSPTADVAQNGIQVGFGATATVNANYVTGNDWTAYGTDANPEVESDFGAGVLLYAAGVNSAGKANTSIAVGGNTLKGNQIGVEVVDSEADVANNSITETASKAITDSIGVFGVGCDAYCGYFEDHAGGAALNTVASSTQAITVFHNTVNFSSTPAGSYGIWLGFNTWTGNASYYAPAGHEVPSVSQNSISNVATPETIAGGA